MRKPKIGDEIEYGINRFKISSINDKEVKYTNGMGHGWDDLERLIYFGKVAVFRGEETVKLK